MVSPVDVRKYESALFVEHLGHETMSSYAYINAKCCSADILAHSKDPVFVDLCCGTGSMSRQAKMMGFKTVISVDVNEEYNPDFCCDILDIDERHPLCNKLDELIKEGRVIVMHCSPPCDQFSRMNTTGFRDVIGAMKVVEKAVEIMSRYSKVWTLENPQTGLLWTQPFAKKTFEHFHDFDYCAYGSITKKCTRFAFSSEEFKDMIVPRMCSSRGTCPSCFLDPVTNRMRHTSMNDMGYNERIAIPSQLCVVLISTFRKMSPIVAEYFAKSVMAHEKTHKKRPMYKEDDTEDSESDGISDSDSDKWEGREVETAVDRRGTGRGVEYFVKWKGCGDEDNRWVPSSFVSEEVKQEYRFTYKTVKKMEKRQKKAATDCVLAQLMEKMEEMKGQMDALCAMRGT